MVNAIANTPSRASMVSPFDLFSEESSETLVGSDEIEEDSRWWVLHTRARAEKALVRHLAMESVAYFLPLYERRRRVQRRMVRTHFPLFPGYLFVHTDDAGRQAALETKMVANCLEVEDQDSMAHDLFRILKIIESGAQLSPEARLQPGMAARITKGPLAGFEGVVLQRKSAFRFVVAVRFMQQGAAVQVDDCMLEPI